MQKINEKVFEILKKKQLTISFCESASAGALSSFLCEVEGSSQVFKGALITYSNEAKINLAKVNPELIKLYGAVSEEVAKAMSENSNRIFNSDICVSITGNASQNTIENKPACFYYIGITIIDITYVESIQLPVHDRNYNRINIAWHALNKLLDYLKV